MFALPRPEFECISRTWNYAKKCLLKYNINIRLADSSGRPLFRDTYGQNVIMLKTQTSFIYAGQDVYLLNAVEGKGWLEVTLLTSLVATT